MSCDNFEVSAAKELAMLYYDEAGFLHACRVVNYVTENLMIPEHMRHTCIVLAYLHDLVEDTDFDSSVLPWYLRFCLDLISKKESESYMDYIRRINEFCLIYPEVYWVKMADIKDHLCLTDTLTDRLRDKYLEALRCLL